jgi:hypothetical protein
VQDASAESRLEIVPPFVLVLIPDLFTLGIVLLFMKTSHIIIETTKRTVTALLVWVCLGVSGTKAAVLLSQGSANTGGWGSSVSTGDTAYGGFTLPLGGIITNVAWTGDVNLDNLPGAFVVTFWSANAGRAGTQLSTQTIIGSAGATDTGSRVGANDIFNYSTSVTPFTAMPGTEYFLSIVAYAGPQWYWENASNAGSGGYEYAIINNVGQYISTGGQAFTLLGTVTPPSLAISQTGNQFVVSWPISASNYVLQTTSNLSIGSWTNITNGINTNGIGYAYTNLAIGNMAYFRLQQQ